MGDTLHLEWPRKKHEENSNQGDLEAVRRGFEGNDHDTQKGKSGISYNTHWKDIFGRDDFYDPLHKVESPTRFDELTDEEIARVVAHTHGETFHIRTTVRGIRHAAKVGLEYIELELKPGNKWTVADCRKFKQTAKDAGIGLIIKTMDNWGGWRRTLVNAKLAGCRTRRIRMG